MILNEMIIKAEKGEYAEVIEELKKLTPMQAATRAVTIFHTLSQGVTGSVQAYLWSEALRQANK